MRQAKRAAGQGTEERRASEAYIFTSHWDTAD